MGRLPEAWIAPPATRELRELVRHRAKLVGLRSNLKCQVHAVLAGAGVPVPMSDLFGAGRPAAAGPARADRRQSRARVDSLLRLIDSLDFEVELFAKLVADRLRARPRLPGDPDRSPGSGRCWPRCSSPRSATSPASPGPRSWPRWAGLTPTHHESDTTVHRGRITKQGSRLVRWAAVEAVQRLPGAHPPRAGPGPGRGPPRPQHRRRRRGPRADRAGLLRPARSPHPRPGPAGRTGRGMSSRPSEPRWARVAGVMTPAHGGVVAPL